MTKKLEVLANIAIIITSLVLCAVLARKHLFSFTKQGIVAASTAPRSPFANTPSKQLMQRGKKISLPGIDWTKSDRTLLLALSTTCHFCTESAPFYQNLQSHKPANLRLIAVFPQSVEDSESYLEKLGVVVSEVVQAQLNSLNVSGTPTLILIDKEGIVQNSWVGKLSNDEAEKVINQINGTMVQ